MIVCEKEAIPFHKIRKHGQILARTLKNPRHCMGKTVEVSEVSPFPTNITSLTSI